MYFLKFLNFNLVFPVTLIQGCSPNPVSMMLLVKSAVNKFTLFKERSGHILLYNATNTPALIHLFFHLISCLVFLFGAPRWHPDVWRPVAVWVRVCSRGSHLLHGAGADGAADGGADRQDLALGHGAGWALQPALLRRLPRLPQWVLRYDSPSSSSNIPSLSFSLSLFSFPLLVSFSLPSPAALTLTPVLLCLLCAGWRPGGRCGHGLLWSLPG